MKKMRGILRVGMMAMLAVGMASAALAQPSKLDKPATIRLATLSKTDAITPKSGAWVFDYDGIKQSVGDVVVSPFTLRALVGGDKVEVSVPEFMVSQAQWVADPIGCVDDDPKTKCHPTWGNEYYGEVVGEVLVYVEPANGNVFADDGSVNMVLNVSVVDKKIRSIDGYLQITFSASTDLPSYRVPISGKLK